jgi:hypothetical protein
MWCSADEWQAIVDILNMSGEALEILCTTCRILVKAARNILVSFAFAINSAR